MTKQHVSLRCRRPRSLLAVTTATALALAAGVAIPTAQSPADAHVAAAKAAAGQDHLFMFNQLCAGASRRRAASDRASSWAATRARRIDRSGTSNR